MIDHSRIQSGFDLEVLLGGDYFLTILGGAYDAGDIPSEIVTAPATDDEEASSIAIGKPTAVDILIDNDEADIEVTIPATLVDDMDVIIGLGVTITDSQISLEYRYLDDTTQGLIQFFGLLTGNAGLLEEVEQQLTESLNQEIELDLVSSDVAEMQVRKVPASANCQAAYGLYLNLDLTVSSQSSAPEEDFIARGNIDNGISFLPENREFAVGFGLQTCSRLANSMWHDFGVERDNGTIDHPVMDGDDRVGVYKSVAIVPINGVLQVTVKSEIFIDNWPDADVTAVFEFRPKVDSGKLEFDVELVEFDADTGLLGDFLGFLLGGLLGGLIGFLFGGPVGAAIGASIGGVGGIATIEITEEVLENQFDDEVEDEAKKAGVASAFSAFPVRKELFTDERDPFYVRRFDVVNLFDEANVNAQGMSFAGHAVMESYNDPVDTTIVDKLRSSCCETSWNGLLSLTYNLDAIGDIEMPIGEVLRRIPLNQLQRVGMEANYIRRYDTVVTDVRFESGVDLYVDESVALQDAHVLYVAGYQLIHPSNASPYYRARADKSLENNFESLPPF